MNRLTFQAFPLILLLVLACSCSKDETSYLSELCVVKERGNHKLYLLSDEGVTLNPSVALDPDKYADGERFRVTYIKMQDSPVSKNESVVEIQHMLPVLTKEAVLREKFTDATESSVWLLSKPWMGGGYLNFEFTFGYENSSIKHGIHLVQDSVVRVGEVEKIHLTFGHDSRGDQSRYMATALASFPLSSIAYIRNADSLILHVREGNAPRMYRIAARY